MILLVLSCKEVANKKIEEKTNAKEKILTDEEIGKAIVEEENVKINSIGILLYDGFFDLDAFGPHSVLSSMVGTNVFL